MLPGFLRPPYYLRHESLDDLEDNLSNTCTEKTDISLNGNNSKDNLSNPSAEEVNINLNVDKDCPQNMQDNISSLDYGIFSPESATIKQKKIKFASLLLRLSISEKPKHNDFLKLP